MFTKGDSFQVVGSGLKGTVTDIITVKGYPHYQVNWEGFTIPAFYNVDMVNESGDWERIAGTPQLSISTKTDECQHEWAEYVGFTETYKYCKKCNIKDA